MTIDTDRARELGRMSGQARRRLTAETVDAALGTLETPSDAKRAFDTVLRWSAAGLPGAGNAGACVRTVERWLKAHDLHVMQPKLAAQRHAVSMTNQDLERLQQAGLHPRRQVKDQWSKKW